MQSLGARAWGWWKEPGLRKEGAGSWQGPAGGTVGGERLEWRRATVGSGSWSGSWGLAGARARRTAGWAALGLAGSPWPAAAPEGGLREAQQEGRPAGSRPGSASAGSLPTSGWGSAAAQGRLRSTRRAQDDVRRAAPAAKPRHPQPTGRCVSSPPALSLAPSPGTFQQGLGEGRNRFWALPGEGAGLPGLLPWGRLENKQAGSQTRDCVENPVGVDGEPSALGGRWGFW